MMRLSNIKMTTTVDVLDLLKKVRENRERHARIVAEAEAGYRERAQKALEERLALVKAGGEFDLHFRLAPPQNHLAVYDTVVSMLTANKETTVVLEADEFRQLWDDEWDWSAGFLESTVGYSAAARDEAGGRKKKK